MNQRNEMNPIPTSNNLLSTNSINISSALPSQIPQKQTIQNLYVLPTSITNINGNSIASFSQVPSQASSSYDMQLSEQPTQNQNSLHQPPQNSEFNMSYRKVPLSWSILVPNHSLISPNQMSVPQSVETTSQINTNNNLYNYSSIALPNQQAILNQRSPEMSPSQPSLPSYPYYQYYSAQKNLTPQQYQGIQYQLIQNPDLRYLYVPNSFQSHLVRPEQPEILDVTEDQNVKIYSDNLPEKPKKSKSNKKKVDLTLINGENALDMMDDSDDGPYIRKKRSRNSDSKSSKKKKNPTPKSETILQWNSNKYETDTDSDNTDWNDNE